MEELRNLTKEAMELAEKDFLAMNQDLAEKEARQRLDAFQKYSVFQHLVMLAEFYELELINSFRS